MKNLNLHLKTIVRRILWNSLTYRNWTTGYADLWWKCRKKGQPYPSKTVQNITAGLQTKMLDTNPDSIKFLDTSQSVFRELRHTFDTVYRDLHSQELEQPFATCLRSLQTTKTSFSQLELWGVWLLRACSELFFYIVNTCRLPRYKQVMHTMPTYGFCRKCTQ